MKKKQMVFKINKHLNMISRFVAVQKQNINKSHGDRMDKKRNNSEQT